MTDYLPCVEVEPATPANATMILMHGLGADGNDLVPIAQAIPLPAGVALRIVSPHAPSLPITVNGGASFPAWYDLIKLGEEREFNRQQLETSAGQLQALIDREIERGIPGNRIFLLGFSQGGAVCYHAGLSYPQRLGGILGLSTYFPTADSVNINPTQLNIPVMMGHGSMDPVIPIAMARHARRLMEQHGIFPLFHTYVMAHQVCQEELGHIAGFVWDCLTAK